MKKGRYEYISCPDGIEVHKDGKYKTTCKNFIEVFQMIMNDDE